MHSRTLRVVTTWWKVPEDLSEVLLLHGSIVTKGEAAWLRLHDAQPSARVDRMRGAACTANAATNRGRSSDSRQGRDAMRALCTTDAYLPLPHPTPFRGCYCCCLSAERYYAGAGAVMPTPEPSMAHRWAGSGPKQGTKADPELHFHHIPRARVAARANPEQCTQTQALCRSAICARAQSSREPRVTACWQRRPPRHECSAS